MMTRDLQAPMARPALPLVGRETELDLLRGLVAAAEAGTGRLLFLSGESGVGKTRLIEALREIAEEAGALVFVGRAYPAEGTFPFAVAADALSQLVRAVGPTALTTLTRGREQELAMILPTLAGGGPAAGGDAADVKARVFWTVEQLLRRVGVKTALILVLENAQWADASSLELMHFLARQLGGARVSAVCTYNPREGDMTQALVAAERSLRKAGLADAHELRPLTPEDVRALVRKLRRMSDGALEPVADRLYTRTLGNPFFVSELLIGAGDASQSGDALPASVRDAVLARVDALDAPSRLVLDCVAAMGARAVGAVIARATGLSSAAAAACLTGLVQRGLLVESADDAGVRYECHHPIVRATVYEALGLATAQQLHARIADAFESAAPGPTESHANELAWHYTRAGDAAPAHHAARFLVLAGRQALARHADREAAALLQAALGRSPSESGGTDHDRSSVLDDLARARQRLGEYDAAYALWAEARRDGAVGAATRARIERQMGLSAFWSGRPHDAIAHYDAAIAVARGAGETGQVVRTLIARSGALRAIGDVGAARTSVEDALALARTVGDNALLARAHRALLLAYAWTGPARDAREHATRALEFAEASGDRTVAWSAQWAMAVLAGFTGDGDAAGRHADAAESLAAELGSPVLSAWSAEIRVEYAAGVGDWAAGLEMADRAIPVARAVAERTLLPRLLVWKGLILLARDDLAGAQTCFDEAWELAGASLPERPDADLHAVIPAHTGRAALHLARGEYAEAIRVGERGLRLADRHGYRAWAIHRLLPVVCEAALAARDFDRVVGYAARLRTDGALLDHRLARAWADAADALLLRQRDADPRAAEGLLRAAADLETIPFVFHAARLRRNAAQLLASDGNRERALEELRRAHEMFRSMGAERELRGTREEIRALGGRPPQRAAPALGGLTGREREIVRLAMDRKTNREIGAALDISPRTVSTHLEHVFKKLGVASRGELIDLARDNPSLAAGP